MASKFDNVLGKSVVIAATRSATTAVEGFVDTLGATQAVIFLRRHSGTIGATLGVRHATASNTAYSSATAFTNAISVTLASAGTVGHYKLTIDLSKTSHERYLILSMAPDATTSSVLSVDAITDSHVSPDTSDAIATTVYPSQP